jgi:hypothetical protein
MSWYEQADRLGAALLLAVLTAVGVVVTYIIQRRRERQRNMERLHNERR